ncbi:MAG: type II toxin-antitoxin system RelE/ParE family toxin [Planctomycetes bacterium]|nr:type II toxin-antitoxin system RelE/ParE family toxin [Planctomycetota bacterium]
MARYRVFIKPTASKELEALGTKKERQRVAECIRGLADDPRPPGCQKLSGAEKYRVRCGVYRVVYGISGPELAVRIVKVGHRRDVYRDQ